VLGLLAAIAVAAIIGASLLGAAGTSKSNSGKPSAAQQRAPQVNASAAAVNALLAGIPQSGNTLGDPRAPITLQYFADLQCPFCRRFTLGTLPSLIQNYVRAGRLKIEYHSLETATKDPQTFEAQQLAALAAGKQNKMWNFVELFYHEQGPENSGYVTENYLQGLAQQVAGLNLISGTSARSEANLLDAIARDARAAARAGLASTPSFVVRKERDTPDASAIESALKR
jgi:protein-disulfide isomerase